MKGFHLLMVKETHLLMAIEKPMGLETETKKYSMMGLQKHLGLMMEIVMKMAKEIQTSLVKNLG